MGELIPIAGMAMIVTLGLPLVLTLVRHLDRASKKRLDSSGLEQLRDELREIHERLDAIEHGDARLTDLEERVDFTERLLAQHHLPRLEEKT